MKALMLGALVSAQILVSAQPALAADLGDERGAVAARQGAFAGARFRVALDGTSARKAQAGLTLALVLQGRQADGRTVTRFGEGMELRLTGGETRPKLALGGRTLAQLTEGRHGPDGRKAGVSTLGWIAIGVGVAAVIVIAAGVTCQETNCLGSE